MTELNRKVAIVIPNYNGGNDLKRLVGELLMTTPHDVPIVIADDGSTSEENKDVLDFLEKIRLPKGRMLEILRNQVNAGVSITSNIGIRTVYDLLEDEGYDIVRLDNDIQILKPYWLREMQEESLNHQFGTLGIGCVSGLILKEDKTIATAGVPIKSKGFFSLRKGEKYDPTIDYNQCLEGAFLAATYIRHEALEAVMRKNGVYFDTRYYPCWVEDVDFCVEIAELGYKTLQSNVPFVHKGDVDNNPPGNLIEIKRKNRQKFKDKWKLDIDLNLPPQSKGDEL